MEWGLLIGAAALLWRIERLESRLDRILAVFYAPPSEDWPTGLAELTDKECETLGWRLGEAGVLGADWDRVWRREYLAARVAKTRRLATAQPAEPTEPPRRPDAEQKTADPPGA